MLHDESLIDIQKSNPKIKISVEKETSRMSQGLVKDKHEDRIPNEEKIKGKIFDDDNVALLSVKVFLLKIQKEPNLDPFTGSSAQNPIVEEFYWIPS